IIRETDNPDQLGDETRKLLEVLPNIQQVDLAELIASSIGSATSREQRCMLETSRLLEVRPSNSALAAIADVSDSLEASIRVVAIRYLVDYAGDPRVDKLLAMLTSEIMKDDIEIQLRAVTALLAEPNIRPTTSRLVEAIFDRGGRYNYFVGKDFLITRPVHERILELCARADYVSDKLAAEARSMISVENRVGLASNLYLAVYETNRGGDPSSYVNAIVGTAKNPGADLQSVAVELCLSSDVVPAPVRNEVFAASLSSTRRQIRKIAAKQMARYVGKGILVVEVVRSVHDDDLRGIFRELERVEIEQDLIDYLKHRLEVVGSPVGRKFIAQNLFANLLRNVDGISDRRLTSFLIDIRRSYRGSLVADAATKALLAQEEGLRDALRQPAVVNLLRNMRGKTTRR
ncbi:MAG: hypothetical protein AAF497_25080, partial [Planctomycetota bacterium]